MRWRIFLILLLLAAINYIDRASLSVALLADRKYVVNQILKRAGGSVRMTDGVEVRLRASERYGGALASVDVYKQKRLARAAQRWLAEHYGERWPACRFDVVTVDGSGTIDWIRDAFAT